MMDEYQEDRFNDMFGSIADSGRDIRIQVVRKALIEILAIVEYKRQARYLWLKKKYTVLYHGYDWDDLLNYAERELL